MESSSVLFKGTRDGIVVTIRGCNSYQSIKEAMDEKISRARNFFKGGKIYIDFSNADFNEEQQDAIKKQIMDEYSIVIQDVNAEKLKMFSGIYEGRTRFLRNTIRSGQNVEYPGNLVIIGDVNAGGQVTAGGNIIVLGTIRGVVHAGASGNEKAFIAAFSLQPTQLRIAGVISRAPDGVNIKPRCPELARIKDGVIIVEPYAPGKYI